MRTKLIRPNEITREDFEDIKVLDIQSETIYENAEEFFIFNEMAKDCYAMLTNLVYSATEILSYSKEEQEEIKYELMIDSLYRLKNDGFILYYIYAQELDWALFYIIRAAIE